MELPERAEVVIVGAGAAGLMAAVWAGRTDPRRTIVALDGARKLGAKILVAGGGRCNVTHHRVTPEDYAGSSRPAIRNVLRRFDVPRTTAFFRELGVELKREETGKLFPTTDDARTVLDALLGAAADASVRIGHPYRVEAVRRHDGGFRLHGPWGRLDAAHLILATGGQALPRSGSDGHGYTLARALGHQVTPHIFPALVPLTLPPDHFLCGLSGLAAPATLQVRAATGKRLVAFTDATLCTHFGLSGPAVLDVSRYYLDAARETPGTTLVVNWLPDETPETLDAALQQPAVATPLAYLRGRLPERLARALCEAAGVDPATPGHQLTRDARRRLVHAVTALPLPVTGNRGFKHAEVTAGGVPLEEVHLKTMASRVCPGLHLCGELCDVDGRIGGFNFQWAWASGYVAGTSVGQE